MKKLEEIQRGKINTSYGAIGSMIETMENGSLLILPFDNWPMYKRLTIGRGGTPDREAKKWIIDEPRLKKRIIDLGFVGLRDLFMPPFGEGTWYRPENGSENNSLLSQRFPEWYFCPHCRKLMKIDKWRARWDKNYTNKGLNTRFDENYPRCIDCSRPKKTIWLEQVRFVLVSMDSGEIKDLPWDTLLDPPQGSTNLVRGMGGTTTGDLWYTTSRSTDSLYGISVQNCDPKAQNPTGPIKKISMAEVSRQYFTDGNHSFAVVIRNGNNVYFPYVINGIYIPKCIPTQEMVNTIRETYEEDGITDIDRLFRNQNRHHPEWHITREQIDLLVNGDFNINVLETSYATEEEFRYDEFKFIVDEANYDNDICEYDENFVAINYSGIIGGRFHNRVRGLYCIKKLKETRCLVAYSRYDSVTVSQINAQVLQNGSVYNIDGGKKWYNTGTGQEDNSMPIGLQLPTTKTLQDVRYMPTVESFGEGLFVEMNMIGIEDNQKETFMHTYCHLIMKELEFQCGYPLASMSERLYFLPNCDGGKYGFMIYAIGGEDGSYGGITSLFDNGAERIMNIMQDAGDRSADCPNDPICELEIGHCFACVDLPETACSEYNKKLDRRVFNNYWKS